MTKALNRLKIIDGFELEDGKPYFYVANNWRRDSVIYHGIFDVDGYVMRTSPTSKRSNSDGPMVHGAQACGPFFEISKHASKESKGLDELTIVKCSNLEDGKPYFYTVVGAGGIIIRHGVFDKVTHAMHTALLPHELNPGALVAHEVFHCDQFFTIN